MPSDTTVPWITGATNLVRTGYFHIALLVISLPWTIASIRASHRIKVAPSGIKASQISVGYELCSQIARAAALAFIIIAAVMGGGQQWRNIVIIGYAFILGLSRLANDLRWRHTALHQVNFLIGTSLLLLAVEDVLPTLELHSTYRPGAMKIGAIVSLATASLVALWTPREWAPPAVTFELLQRPAEAGPAPEETCSWWNLYLTYEWLTPLVWKGMCIVIPLHLA